MCDGLFWCCRHCRLCCCCCFCCVDSVLFVSPRFSFLFHLFLGSKRRSSNWRAHFCTDRSIRVRRAWTWASGVWLWRFMSVYMHRIWNCVYVFFANSSSQQNVLHKARQMARPSRRPPTSHSCSHFYLSALLKSANNIWSAFFFFLLVVGFPGSSQSLSVMPNSIQRLVT